MREAIEQRGRHLGVAEHGRPFPEGEIGGDDDRGPFVEPADEVEEQLAAGLGKGQIAELVEHCEVEPGQVVGAAPLLSGAMLGLEAIDQIDDIEEAATRSIADEGAGDRDRQMRLAGSGAADEDGVALVGDEGAGSEVADQRLVDGRGVIASSGRDPGERGRWPFLRYPGPLASGRAHAAPRLGHTRQRYLCRAFAN